MNKHFAHPIILLGIAVICSGCGTTAKFVYPADPTKLAHLSETPRYDKEVAVLPFEELRGNKNSSGTYWLYAIPLMPCGWCEYQRPDAARMFLTIGEFQFDPHEDLAKAAATSLQQSGLFKDAYFTYGGEKANADLLFTGEIQSTTYKGAIYSYGLSVEGPLLWLIGLPAGSSIDDLKLKFALTDARTNEKLWEHTYTGEKKIIQGLYYHFGYDVMGYSELMEDMMNEAIVDMDKSLQSQRQTNK
jgi:hypothetical protein